MYATKKYDNNISHIFYKSAIKSWRQLDTYFIPGCIQSIRRDCIYENRVFQDDNGNTFKLPSHFPPYAPEFVTNILSQTIPENSKLFIET